MAVKTSPVIRKFNPGALQPDDEVIKQFVVRHREFNILMGVLRNNAGASPCQHMLVVAPRGRGKTMMLARIAAELRTSTTLQQAFLPIRFMEESYEVFDLGDFWLDALFHLAPEVARHDGEIADELREAHAEFARRWRGRDLEERARAVVLETAERLDKKLVLMVENCQSLFDDADERFGWGLRKTLQTETNVIFLGTATTRISALDDVQAPFYEFFRPLLLEPLPLDECKALWEAASGEVRSEREIRPLQILTGGDPRLLVIIAGFARHRSMKELLQELVSLIDDHTEYFRSHLEGLSKTERRVYLALIDLWQPSTTAEIAARAMQEVRVVSSLLGRLVKRGAVTYEGSGQKRLYAATQRLYGIYYKLRRQRDEAPVVRSLVQWMTVCFTSDKPPAPADTLAEEAIQSKAIREGFLRPERAEASELIKKALECSTGNDPATAIALCEEVAHRFGDHEGLPLSLAMALTIKGMVHENLEHWDDAIAAYDEIERLPSDDKPEVRAVTCMALANKVRALGRAGRLEAALAAHSNLNSRFGEDRSAKVREQVAAALLHKGSVYAQMGRNEDAVAAWDQVVASYGSEGPTFQWTVAVALLRKSTLAAAMGGLNLAIATSTDLVKRFHNSNASWARDMVATALTNRAEWQIQLNLPDEALGTIEELAGIDPLLDATELQWAEWTRARALLGKQERKLALEVLRTAYDNLIINEETPRRLLYHVPELIGCGLAESDLMEILTSDRRKRTELSPLVAALGLRIGEKVRAPVEVLEAAQDLAKHLDAAIAQVKAR